MAQIPPMCLPSVSRTLTGDSVGLMGHCMGKVQVQKGEGAVAAGTADPNQAGVVGAKWLMVPEPCTPAFRAPSPVYIITASGSTHSNPIPGSAKELLFSSGTCSGTGGTGRLRVKRGLVFVTTLQQANVATPGKNVPTHCRTSWSCWIAGCQSAVSSYLSLGRCIVWPVAFSAL